jgi:poly-gamma-glutamate capsule biosynthesis protein CapA/YwtB (metallophosphatase superfamily)
VSVTIALAGDTMLGRGVAERLTRAPPGSLVHPELVEVVREADLFLLNLECCISEGGTQWPAEGKPFFFRAPPAATELLGHLGVDAVTLANNHALDFGAEALLDTFDHLAGAGIAWVGAGPDLERARRPEILTAKNGFRLAVVGVTDHPSDFAAGPDRAGVAFADLKLGIPYWLPDLVRSAGERADAVLVSPHWGPNMTAGPVPHVRRAAEALLEAGATLVAGHSAHVVHGIHGRVLFDLGDFLDDYAVDAALRNDLGLVFLVTLEDGGPSRIEAIPIALDFCFTRPANREESSWIGERFTASCRAMGTDVARQGGRLVASPG